MPLFTQTDIEAAASDVGSKHLFRRILAAFRDGSYSAQSSGVTASRPTGNTNSPLVAGQSYYDTTLGLPIWYSGAGGIWKNAAGATV